MIDSTHTCPDCGTDCSCVHFDDFGFCEGCAEDIQDVDESEFWYDDDYDPRQSEE